MTIQIDHYSDVLCIWAYVSQIRVDELLCEYGDKINVKFHFFPVFGDVPGKTEKSWGERGGITAYGEHVQKVAEGFEHLQLHPDVWVKNTPQSSLPAHLYLVSVQQLEAAGEAEDGSFVRFMNCVRNAFFIQAIDISKQGELRMLAERCGLPVDAVQQKVDTGQAHAVICRNMHTAVEQGIKYSPTLLFNEGRQKLSGNVGYRIIEANIRELLENPAGQLSWC